jgi:hypothetical protein
LQCFALVKTLINSYAILFEVSIYYIHHQSYLLLNVSHCLQMIIFQSELATVKDVDPMKDDQREQFEDQLRQSMKMLNMSYVLPKYFMRWFKLSY